MDSHTSEKQTSESESSLGSCASGAAIDALTLEPLDIQRFALEVNAQTLSLEAIMLTKLEQDTDRMSEVGHEHLCMYLKGVCQTISVLTEEHPELASHVESSIKSCHCLETIISKSLCENSRLLQKNRELEFALYQERAKIRNLQARCVDQQTTLAGIDKLFPVLQEEMRDILSRWKDIGCRD